MSTDWRSDVLKFWFGLDPALWWKADPALDHRITQSFLKLWAEKRQLPVEAFLDDPLTALAGVILFDQLPRNMFRGHADQFATDHLALAIAKAAIDRNFDEELQPQERGFLYAQKHHDIIERFGRFPHRNAILGRAPRQDEAAAGTVTPF